jgi:type IV secretory pathway VirJ component
MSWFRSGRLLFIATTLAMTMACSREPQVKIVVDNDDFADLQQVQIYRADTVPTPTINGIAFLIGTENDWRNGSTQLANKLAAAGWLVAGIHFDNFVNARKTQNADCLELVTLLDVFSQHLQQRYRISNYQRPLLIGYGQGGSAAYLTLAQSAAGIFRGAVSLGRILRSRRRRQ